MTRRVFVYDLPYAIRKSLCRILDSTDKWEELGGEYMKFDYTYLQYIRKKDSPTDELLTSWSNQNHTVNDLFVLLSKMHHYRAMSLLRDLVDEQHHHLLREGEELMNITPNNKNVVDQDCLNRVDQQPNVEHVHIVEESSNAAARFPTVPCTVTFEDNKDLGLDLRNLNLATQKPENQVAGKNVNEIKIQNLPNNRRSPMFGQNVNPQKIEIMLEQADPSPQIEELSVNHIRRQERKLSNVSLTSSVMEGCTPIISYEELEVATSGWDSTCILGRGGFGTVYKGTWKNTLVAIKKLESQKDEHMKNSKINDSQMEQSLRELKYLNSHRHDNILSLYGYSVTDSASCLVYQYMANGSLEDRLQCRQNTTPLTWAQRLNIMTGTARGIQFLHSLGKKPLVHGDIKSANILLDSNFEPRLGDFGLAREGPMQQYTHVKVSRVHGTRPYLPDEFLRGKQFSVKVDTYSFGVVLFEVSTGLRAYDDNRKEKFLKDHIVLYLEEELCNLADPQAGRDCCASAAGLLTLGRNCVMTRPRDRPDMKIVLNDVEMLYTNYKRAENAKCLAQQQGLTPTTPLEKQLVHDERHNHSPQPAICPFQDLLSQQPLIINGSTVPHKPQGFQFPRKQPPLSPPEPQHFPQDMGKLQGFSNKETGLPQAIIIHHPPVPVPYTSPSNMSEANNVHASPSPVDSCHIPLVTLLGMKPEPKISKAQLLDSAGSSSVKEPSTKVNRDSVQSNSVTHFKITNSISSNHSDDELARGLSDSTLSAYIPVIPELMGISSPDS